MTTQWTLKKWLAVNHDIFRATDIKKRIFERTGVVLSLPSVCALLNEQPKMLRISTLQLICTTFGSNLSEFFDITPDKPRRARTRRPHAAHGKRKMSDFPSATDYQGPKKQR